METEKTFSEVKKAISAGNIDAAEMLLLSIASSSEDPLVRIQCSSALLTIGRSVASEKVLEELSTRLPEDPAQRFQVAQAMRGLGRADLAAEVLEDLGQEDTILREYATALNMLGRYADSIAVAEKISVMRLSDRVLIADGLSSSGNYGKALEMTESMLAEFPASYDVKRSRCTALISAGMEKEAVKFVRSLLKKDKNSSDSNALAAYVMHVEGKDQSAGAFASKALRTDPSHVGAMEVLALSLMNKGRYRDAGIIAGAINEKDPGNTAAVKILKECGGKQ